MALVIEGGISIGGSITITAQLIDPAANLVVFYDAGNSMCYSGSGATFNVSYTGPNLTGYNQYGVVDLAGLTGGPWNSTILNQGSNAIAWTSQGVASYFSFNAPDENYLSSDYQRAAPTLTTPTYSIVAVVRPQDFSQGAIVGGDENVFAFGSSGGLNGGPSLAAGNSYGSPAVVDTTTAYETNTWYCVAVTYNAGTGVMKLYSNGNLVSTANTGSPTHPTSLYWGTLEGDLWYTGDMAVCMAYERVLGASEISQLSSVYLSRYGSPATSSAVFNIPYTGGPPATFTVPEGVTSISVVAVGGGGGGTIDSYAVPGGDTAVLRTDNFVGATTTYTGVTDIIRVDNVTTPNIANVTADGSWVVTGTDIPGTIPAWDLVTHVAIDGEDPTTTLITIDQTITTTAGDEFTFYQGVAVAEGGYEVDGYYYNQANLDPSSNSPNGPGARSKALVTDGPYGAGGVVDWTYYDPVGGGGAGGYGISGLALDIDQAGSWIYNNSDNSGWHTLAFSNNNLTVTALIGVGTSQANQECQVLGTQLIPSPTAKIMYSVNVSQTAGIGYCGVGLSNRSANLQNYTGSSFDGVGYFDDGRVFVNSDTIATFAPFNEGGIIDIVLDMTRDEVWFRVSGGLWNNSAGADPAASTGGLGIAGFINQGYDITLALCPWYDDTSSTADIITINTTSPYAVPTGFTFVPGVPGAGGTGGQGASFYAGNNTNGTGGSGAGGGGLFENTGGGGSGTGLYGRGTNGVAGNFVPYGAPGNTVSTISTGGSNNSVTDGAGGQATPWNGGRGGWPGGAGGSGIDYYMGANGGALAYRNNYAVTPGEQFYILPGLGGLGQNGGGSGASGAIRVVWPGDTRQFPTTNVGADTIAVPTLDITGHNFPNFDPTGTLNWTISSDGGSTVLETGVVWGLPGQDTYLDSTDVCDGTSSTAQRKAIRAADSCGNPYTTGLTGAQSLNFNSYVFNNEEIQVRAYARNAAGVAYSATTLTWTPVICLAQGTLITLADGTTKPIESVTMSDHLKVWDFDNKTSTSAMPLWIKKQESTIQFNVIKFSDGTILKTIGQHRIFNKQAGAFTYPMTDATPVGTITVKSDGTEVTVVSKKIVYEQVNYYNLITAGGYINCYAEGILTSCRYSNIYPVVDMQYVKDSRVLRNRSEFAGIADRWIDGLRLPEQTIDLKHIKRYCERLEKNEAQDTPAPATPTWHR